MTPTPSLASRNLGASALTLLVVSVGLYFGRPIFIPTIIALLLACLLWPAVGYLARYVPWAVSCTLIMAVVVSLLSSCAYATAITLPQFAEAFPRHDDEVQRAYTHFRERLGRLSPVFLRGNWLPPKASESPLVKNLRDILDPDSPKLFASTFLGVGAALYLLLQTTLVLFLLFFFLLEGHLLSRRLVEAISREQHIREQTLIALQEMAGQIRGYLFWRTAINVVMAIMFGLIYQFCGLAQPWTWALLTGVLLYVPYLGTILAGIPPIVDAFITVDSPWIALGILLYYIAFTTIEGYFIVPLVMGRSLELNASTVLLTTLYWEVVWGPAGLFLSMPLMAIAKTICANVPGWEAWGRLMDTDSATEG